MGYDAGLERGAEKEAVGRQRAASDQSLDLIASASSAGADGVFSRTVQFFALIFGKAPCRFRCVDRVFPLAESPCPAQPNR
jgi:hypothetical protein